MKLLAGLIRISLSIIIQQTFILNLKKPATPAMEKPQSSIMNFDINFNELPTSAKRCVTAWRYKEFGVGVGQGLRLGGLGVFG